MEDDGTFSEPFALSSLSEVVHVMTVSAPGWLVAVQFRFDEGYLSVEANPADDTIEVSLDPLNSPSLRHWATDSTAHSANEYYSDVLGMTSTWRWVLRNQRGYQDAFQLELGPAASTVTFQYLVSASRILPRRVINMPII